MSSQHGSYLIVRSQSGLVSNSLSFFFQAPPHLDQAVVLNRNARVRRVTLSGQNLGSDKRGLCVFNSGYISRLELVGSAFVCTVPSVIVKSAVTSTISVMAGGQSSNVLTFTV
eukprot:TRINITY_DN2332_c0_g1_i1.p1 TRINITY_DN2332_c0_g1~~TRINITY_DN2332_c0_g1_i1.p1  ORF type:complete len:113 (-),score=10.04 TRINITY_DN2332_c0_g1_i1:79-417(-)